MKLTNGERAVIASLMQQIEGVDKNEARFVVAVGDTLELDNQLSFRMNFEEQDEEAEYDLAGIEYAWVKDLLNNGFNRKRISPFLAKHALSLSEKMDGNQ